MRKIYSLVLAFVLFGAAQINAQVTVTNPGNVGPTALNATYTSLALAIQDLNTKTSITGPVTITLNAGNPQTSPAGGYSISPTLAGASATNLVTIAGSGNTITAPNPAGTAGALNDAIFKIIGSDFITLSGFVMNENALNTTTAAATNNMVEWGVAVLYATSTNGAQNITIQGNTIDLNRTYQNTFGIYSNSTHTATAVGTSATATTAAGGNSGLKIYSNNITDVNQGIVVVGPTAAADQNTGVEIGGTGLGNTITNYGTTGTFSAYANVSGTVNGILVRNSNGFVISNNSITSSAGGTTAGTLNGIQVPASSTAPTTTFTNNINNNTIALQSAVAAGAINGINYPSGSASTTSVLNINSNNFTQLNHSVTASGAIIAILTASTNLTTSISSNTFTNLTTNTTGSFTFISHSYTIPATGSASINSNSIVTAFSKTGAGGTVTLTTTNGSSSNTASLTQTNNNFSNITVTGATAITGFNNTDGATSSSSKTITSNIFNGWTGGTSAILAMNYSYWGGGSTNTLSNNSITNLSGQGAVTGISINSTFSGTNTVNISSNTITGLTSSGTGGAVVGITCSNTSTTININNNSISTLSSTGASVVSGIQIGGATTTNVFKNTICDISGSNASSTVNGILLSVGATVNISNNRVGDLRTPAANAANPLNGINITGGTTANVYYNSVFVNGSSSGALFGSSAISATTSSTVTLRNNIFVNTSSVNGAAFAAAYRRSTATLTSYGAASNNNLFYAGTPSATNVIYFDNTNNDQTLSAYKTRVASRDASSVSENPSFLSTACGNTNFLKINTATATQIESGGAPVSGFTDDFEGDTRNASTPDIGADEFAGTPLDLVAPTISGISLVGNACGLVSRDVTATITDASGVATGGGLEPRIYFRKNAGAYSSAAGTFAGSWSFTINYASIGGVTSGDLIEYFIVAQDINGNAGGNPSGGLSLSDVNTINTPPTTPLSYTIQNSLSGTYTVGAAGTYTTLTAAVTAYNTSCLAGPVVFSLIDASYTEAAAMTINANTDASATNTLTIKPTLANTTIAVTGGSASAIFVLNGADYVTINGSTSATANTVCPLSVASRDLTITNTSASTSSAVVWLQTATGANAATNNAVINCNLVGNSNTTTLFGVGSGSTTISTTSLGTANNSNSFVNNNISKTQYGIYSGGASTGNKNTGNTINQNLINTVSPNNVALGGILASFENNITISGNTISEINGTADRFAISAGFGISFSGGTTVSSEVTNATITNNVIGNIVGTGTNTSLGIALGAATSGTSLIANNMVYGVSHNSTSPDIAAGIAVGGGTGSTTNVFHNTVSMQGTVTGGTAATQTSACLAITATTAPTLVDVRNNIFSNTQANNSGATMRFTAIALGYSSTLGNYSGLTSNNNDLYAAGSLGTYTVGITGGMAGTNRTTLSAWTTETGKDAASVNVLPVFLGTADLHLNNTSNPSLDGTAATGTGITADIDCETRSGTPDMGADEFAAPNCTGAAGGTASGNATFCSSGTPTITATGYSTGTTSSYQWYSSTNIGDYPSAGTAVGGQTNPASLTTGVVSTTTYYWLRVTCGANSSTDNSTMVTVTVNPLPGAVTAGGAGTFCASTVITATGGSGGTIYFQGTTSGGTSTATPSTSETVTASGTYYFRAQTALGCWGTEGSVAVVIQTDPVITGTPATICAGASGTIAASAANNCAGFANAGTSLAGTFTAGDPQALRPTTSMINNPVCGFDPTIQRGYQAQQFQVSVTGSYTFDMTSTDDGMAYITTGAFVPGNCGGGGTWVRGDDDSGPGNDPQLLMTLTTGVTYTLYSTTYGTVNGNSTAAYSWTITPPGGGQIMLPSNGTIDWYTVSSGGTSVGTGSPFNPVPSVLANTNTPGTTTLYAACSNASACRTAVNFVINANYDIVATSGANGSVTPAGTTTLSCDGTGDQTYTITPDPGYLISDLIVDGTSNTALTTGSYAAGGTYDFIDVTANHTISATFAVACTNVGITNVTASNPGPLCSGQTTNLTANGVVGTNAVVTWWTGQNGTGTNLGTGTSLNNVGANTYYARVTGDCGTPAEASITINSTGNIFTGTGNWSDNARWSCGAPPSSGDAVTIAAGANATLDVNFTVSGSLTMTPTSTLIVSPTRTLSVDVAATANFAGQSVTFQSDATGYGSLGQVNGTLSGATNVTVERYIPNNGFRSWRLLSVPVTTSQTIRQAWQEGDANPLPKDNNLVNRGTQITGVFSTAAAAYAAGFDSTSVQAGMLRWNGASWSNITSTNQPINNFSSYFLYIRGERSRTVTGSINNSSATTLRTIGTVYTGDQVNSVGAGAFALVPNLYPSAINFTGLTRTGGVNNLFYIWDSKKLQGQSLGVYQTFSATNSFNCLISGGSYTLGQPNTTIESGQSFFVTSGAAGTITLKETAKVSGTNGNLGFRPTPSAVKSKIDTRLFNSSNEMLDANSVVFDAVYSKAVSDEDAPKMGNPGANFAIETDSKLLAIAGTAPVKENDAIQFRMWNMAAGTYKLEFALSNMSLPAGTSAILEDSYLNTKTVLNTMATTTVNFTVDANTASAVANRFRVVIGKAGALYGEAGFTIAPNPVETGVMNVVFSKQAAGKYGVRIVSAGGQVVSAYRLTHAGGSANQSISLPAVMGNGTYTVEIVSPDKSRTVKTVLVNRK